MAATVTSAVKCCLKVVLDAAKKSTDIRREVASELDELDQKDIEAYIMTFPEDQNVIKASINMVASILKAIEDVISYYIKNTVAKAIIAVFSGEEYQRSLTQSLEQIKTSGQLLVRQAQNSNMWQNRQVWETTVENSTKLDQVVEGQRGMVDTQNAIKIMIQQLDNNLANEKRQREEIESLQQQNAKLAAQIVYYQNTPSPSLDVSSQWHITQEALLSMIGLPDLHHQDMARVLRSAELIRPAERELAGRQVASRQFRDWLTAPASRELLIHGSFPGTQYISALSLFFAALVRALQAPPTTAATALVFFCGAHVDADPASGGRGLIRSLLAQLLQTRAFDTGARLHAHGRVDMAAVAAGDPGALCALFGALLAQLPGGAVFCAVDGVRYYEREVFVDNLGTVLGALLDLTRDDAAGGGGGAVFKVLVTSPAPTRVVRQAFDAGDILSMDSVKGGEKGQRFNSAQFERLLKGGLEHSEREESEQYY